MARCHHNWRRQSGVFSIELAIIAPLIAMILMFATDMVSKQSIKGRLQVAAYSAVSLIKERVLLFHQDDNAIETLSNDDVQKLLRVVEGSIDRTMADFEVSKLDYFFEQYMVDAESKEIIHTTWPEDNPDCQPDSTLDKLEGLHNIETSRSRLVSLYQVTLCYRDNSFGGLVGGNYSLLKSNAIMPGR